MESNFLNTLEQVLSVLSSNKKLSVRDGGLISFSNGEILTPVGNIYSLLRKYKSSLKNQSVNINSLQELIGTLSKTNSIIRLNHIGFCYKVDSQQSEKERLVDLVNKSSEHLYIEPSNDEGIWLFVGNNENWQRMMIELIPIEETKDKWEDYWLPHIHIDIDSTLTESEIAKYVKSVFGDNLKPFPIEIDGTVYIVRNRLGVVDGVNIMLDIATNFRNVKYQRQTLLRRVDN